MNLQEGTPCSCPCAIKAEPTHLQADECLSTCGHHASGTCMAKRKRYAETPYCCNANKVARTKARYHILLALWVDDEQQYHPWCWREASQNVPYTRRIMYKNLQSTGLSDMMRIWKLKERNFKRRYDSRLWSRYDDCHQVDIVYWMNQTEARQLEVVSELN